MILVIDDLRTFKEGVAEGNLILYAKDSATALDFLIKLKSPIDEIWFDHDLGGEDTAYRVATWLEARAHFNTVYYQKVAKGIRMMVHTANPVGRGKIVAALSGYNVTVVDPKEYFTGG